MGDEQGKEARGKGNEGKGRGKSKSAGETNARRREGDLSRLTIIDSPEYVNPLKFSCTLLVNGLPPNGFNPGLCAPLPLMAIPDALIDPTIELDVPFAPPAPAVPPALLDWLTHPSIGSSSSKGLAADTDVDVNSGSKLATDSSDSTTGLKGGVTCFEARATQSTDLKKG